MIRNQVNTKVVQFARLGQEVSNAFRVVLHNRATFDAVMGVLGHGNRFAPAAIAATFGELYDGAMTVEFGHEYGEVLYVTVPYYEHQRNDGGTKPSSRIVDADRQAYAQAVIDWARSQEADAITVRQYPEDPEGDRVGTPGPNPYEIRLWWD